MTSPDAGVRFYASELIDSDTCDACRAVDDRDYATREDALRDYPDGGPYRGCTSPGGCRGTLVEVSSRETPATLRWPYGRPPER